MKYIYDLPVYRVPYEKYNDIMDQKLQESFGTWIEITGSEPPREVVAARAQHQYEEFGPWQFNEIVGYIRLHILGSQIRGEYFSAEKMRNPLSRKRVFTFRTLKLASEVEIGPPHPLSSAQVWEAIKKYVERCRRELKTGRVIDDRLLTTIGPYVDWLAVMDRS